MKNSELGRLERVNLRSIWESESGDFTPWLAQEANIKLLGDTLGMELQLEAQEKGIGAYRADIVCLDTADESWVLVENQLNPTDHGHLGQILTYAAGLGAVTIVWIAERFTDEHRAALDWLNEITTAKVQFFGLEVEVWRIGESASAPKFNIVAKPNDWTKGGGRGTKLTTEGLTDSKKLQLGFWQDFRRYVLNQTSVIKPTKALPQHWMNIAIGKTGFKLTAIASLYDSTSGGYNSHEVRAEFEINDKLFAKQYFSLLENEKEAITLEAVETLTWYNPDNANVCKIYMRRSANLEDADQRAELFQWLLSRLENLHSIFAKRISYLTPSEEVVPEE